QVNRADMILKVLIREREYEYNPAFPEGWKFQAGDHFKYPVSIANHQCFVKRFEKRTSDKISGLQLLRALKGKNIPNLPRVHDIVKNYEKGKDVYYVFYEFAEGETLNETIAQHDEIDLNKLNDDLFDA